MNTVHYICSVIVRTMGIIERKITERATKKTLIIKAAFDLYAENGFENTSIRQIADKIDYSPSTIYLYYKDKDAIFYEMQKVAFEMLLDQFRLTEAERNPYKKLRRLGEAYIDFGIAYPKEYDLMFVLSSPMKAIEKNNIWENGLAAFGYLQDIISDCIDADIVQYSTSRSGCLQCWSMLHGLTSLYLKSRFTVVYRSEKQSIKDIHLSWNEYMDIIKK